MLSRFDVRLSSARQPCLPLPKQRCLRARAKQGGPCPSALGTLGSPPIWGKFGSRASPPASPFRGQRKRSERKPTLPPRCGGTWINAPPHTTYLLGRQSDQPVAPGLQTQHLSPGLNNHNRDQLHTGQMKCNTRCKAERKKKRKRWSYASSRERGDV